MAAKGARNGGGSGHGPGRRGVLSFKLKFNTTSRYDDQYFNFTGRDFRKSFALNIGCRHDADD